MDADHMIFRMAASSSSVDQSKSEEVRDFSEYRTADTRIWEVSLFV